jgi:hypothetical protein
MKVDIARSLMPMCVFLLAMIIISLSLFRTIIKKIKFMFVYPATYLVLAIVVYLITLVTGQVPGQGFLWSFLFILGFPSTLLTDNAVNMLKLVNFAYFVAPVLGVIQYFIIGCLIDFIAFVISTEDEKPGR